MSILDASGAGKKVDSVFIGGRCLEAVQRSVAAAVTKQIRVRASFQESALFEVKDFVRLGGELQVVRTVGRNFQFVLSFG